MLAEGISARMHVGLLFQNNGWITSLYLVQFSKDYAILKMSPSHYLSFTRGNEAVCPYTTKEVPTQSGVTVDISLSSVQFLLILYSFKYALTGDSRLYRETNHATVW